MSTVGDAYLLSGFRSPIGRFGGALSGERPDDLAAAVLKHTVEHSGVPPKDIDEVYFGCANQAGEDNRNVARMAVLLAGLPEEIPGVTLNRLCASGLSAVVSACQAIRSGEADLLVAGGVESMSRSPFVFGKPSRPFERGERTIYDSTLGWRFPNPAMAERVPLESMGETGENVADRWQVNREDQDRFALRSQERWLQADRNGRFEEQLIPVAGLTRDEHPRPETDLESLGRLKPAFRPDGTVTAGNSSGMNDGAAAVVIASEDYLRRNGLQPRLRFVSSGAAGVDPRFMGIGPVPATKRALGRADLKVGDLDLVELNEAFASQAVAVVRELELDPERVNVNGGAIAMGHPLGMSGARLVVGLLHEMPSRGARYGLATLCVGVGQGQAAIFENVNQAGEPVSDDAGWASQGESQ